MGVSKEKRSVSYLDGFSPPLILPEIQDKGVVKTEYKYWRIRILYSMFIGYAFYYFTRKSFTFAMPGLIQDLGFDKSQLGLLASILSITYGISKFASGIIGDQNQFALHDGARANHNRIV